MSDSARTVDLSALSAKLRQDDQQFRRTFALGAFAGDGPKGEERGGAVGDWKARLAALVEARTGMDVGSGGACDRLDRVLVSLPISDIPAWLGALEAEPTDGPTWAAMIAGLTVQETYFFRDADQLEFLRRQCLSELVAARRGQESPRLQCWCAGCATGEEVYTMAILVVEALRAVGEAELRPDGVIAIHPRWRVSVLGTDIDRGVVAQAATGRFPNFPMGPFRSLPQAVSGYFLDQIGTNQRVVRPEIRALTSFRPFNLADPEPPILGVDLVLCRNVLIYLSDRVRSHAHSLFHRALARDGYLALGPTDTLRGTDLFQPCWGRDTVVYRKKE